MYLLQKYWVSAVLYDKAGGQNNGKLNTDFLNVVWNTREQPAKKLESSLKPYTIINNLTEFYNLTHPRKLVKRYWAKHKLQTNWQYKNFWPFIQWKIV